MGCHAPGKYACKHTFVGIDAQARQVQVGASVRFGHVKDEPAGGLGALRARGVGAHVTRQPELQQPPFDQQARPARLHVRLHHQVRARLAPVAACLPST